VTTVEPSKATHKRLRGEIVAHLEDFPRQYAALENAMGTFGENFDLAEFKRAFNSSHDMDAYNRVQAVERALGRIQNFVADLASAGVRLSGLPLAPVEADGSPAQQAFDALRDANVIDGELCRRLIRAQKARPRIEHGYAGIPAGDVHRAAQLVHDSALDFIVSYRPWIAPLLEPAAE
jgi:uncharacterized protein YutE (UPF0331/DUF86 family)